MNSCTLKVKEAMNACAQAFLAEMRKQASRHADHARVTCNEGAAIAARKLEAACLRVVSLIESGEDPALTIINSDMRLYIPASVAAEIVLRERKYA